MSWLIMLVLFMLVVSPNALHVCKKVEIIDVGLLLSVQPGQQHSPRYIIISTRRTSFSAFSLARLKSLPLLLSECRLHLRRIQRHMLAAGTRRCQIVCVQGLRPASPHWCLGRGLRNWTVPCMSSWREMITVFGGLGVGETHFLK